MLNASEWWALSAKLISDHSVAFLVLAFMLKCLLLSLYCLLLYFIIRIIKHYWAKKMSVRANYYIWYALLLCIPLSGLWFNNTLKLPFYSMFIGRFNFTDIDVNTLNAIEGFTAFAGLVRSLLLAATVIWLFAVILKSLRQIVINVGLQRAIRRQTVFDDKDGLKKKAAEALGVSAFRIKVVAADFIQSPVSYGVFRKNILLPHDYKDRYPPSELYLLLLHEMGHIKNHDTVKLQLMDIISCFIWPLSLAKKSFIQDSEILCDNRVLGIWQDERDAYGALIVQECSSQRSVKGLGFSDSFHSIKSRLDAIYAHKPEKHHVAVFSVVVALLLAGAAVYAFQVPAPWLVSGRSQDRYVNVDIWYVDGKEGERAQLLPYEIPLPEDEPDWEELELKADIFYKELNGTYSFEDGKLLVDKVALFSFLQPYVEEGLDITAVDFSVLSPQYMDTERWEMDWESITVKGSMIPNARATKCFTLNLSELERTNESNRMVAYSCGLAREELIWLFIAHWL